MWCRYLFPHEVSAFTSLEEDLTTALASLVASHAENAKLMQCKDLAFTYSKQVMHSKHSLVLVLNQEVGASSACSMVTFAS